MKEPHRYIKILLSSRRPVSDDVSNIQYGKIIPGNSISYTKPAHLFLKCHSQDYKLAKTYFCCICSVHIPVKLVLLYFCAVNWNTIYKRHAVLFQLVWCHLKRIAIGRVYHMVRYNFLVGRFSAKNKTILHVILFTLPAVSTEANFNSYRFRFNNYVAFLEGRGVDLRPVRKI